MPEHNIIGEPGQGWAYIGDHLEWERLSLAATYVGNARTALEDTITYTRNRTQFGRSLSLFQVLGYAADVAFKTSFNGMQARAATPSCRSTTWSATSARPSTRWWAAVPRRSSEA